MSPRWWYIDFGVENVLQEQFFANPKYVANRGKGRAEGHVPWLQSE